MNKIIYACIIILSFLLIFKLLELSKITSTFPFEFGIDYSSHIARAHFLKEYGFHNSVPNWYNGFTLSLIFPPLSYYLINIVFLIFNNWLISTFAYILLTTGIGITFSFLLAKEFGLNKLKSILFSLLFYANPISIAWLFANGRIPEMLAWSFFMICVWLIFRLKNGKKDNLQLALPITMSCLLLSHFSVFIVFIFIFTGVFLSINKKSKFFLTYMFTITLIITSFWWIPFIMNFGNSSLSYDNGIILMISPTKQFLIETIYSLIIGFGFFIFSTLFFYSNKKKNLLIFLPTTIFSILYALRIASLIPLINRVWPDTYNLLITFLGILLFLDLKIKRKQYKQLFNVSLFLFCLISVLLVQTYVSDFNFDLKGVDTEILELLPSIINKFLIFGNSSYQFEENALRFPKQPIYSYAAIYYNLSTPDGWFSQGASSEIVHSLNQANELFDARNCSVIKFSELFETKQIISYLDGCDFFKNCGLISIKESENACLFNII